MDVVSMGSFIFIKIKHGTTQNNDLGTDMNTITNVHVKMNDNFPYVSHSHPRST